MDARGIPPAPLNTTDDDLREDLRAALGRHVSIQRELGGGGMSRVFVAWDEALGRSIVVKVLSPELAGTLSTERFEREVRVLAALQDPHIVPVLAAGLSKSGLPFYTMPFVRGETLRVLLDASGGPPLREAAAILRTVARALAFAHREGVVHRDIKPENVLISSGTAVVADFGIAKALDAARHPAASGTLTVAGVSLGTPAYMAPEQAVGDPAIDARADLYSWAVVAYETFTGRHPFAEHTTYPSLVAAHLTQVPAPIAEHLPGLPDEIAQVITLCLEKDPARRPASADAVVASFDAAVWDARDRGTRRRRVTAAEFLISDDVCRRIDRQSLDPQVIGRSLQYGENDAPADALLLCLHGLGSEQAEFASFMSSTGVRALAPTLLGFEPVVRGRRVAVSIDTHLALLREFLRDAVARHRPRHVVVLGFSSGADLALRLARIAPANDLADGPRIHACLALGPNLGVATCFASGMFARAVSGNQASLLADLQRIATGTTDLDEWLNVMTYVIHALRKFRGDVEPLTRLAADIVEPFNASDATFADWYREVSSRVDMLRCVFENSETCVGLVQQLRLRHLDSGVLGARHRPESLAIEESPDHFALLDAALIQRHVDALLAGLAAADAAPT